jgi:hypothetical protein
MRAHGTRQWSFRLHAALPRGRYRIAASALDLKGNREGARRANTVNFTVR